ncbi:GAF domain-containing sensor histidine kinase [Undibacterium sp. Jales W-56]|uniref:GAF domain-containing sensor histidine kinase n=1 Tax=Undibacterium sp. Jales W-56 TaxID=2897325 RepID=UPI0021D30E4B|nr:GAF domain-containing sensor histidine kinase [Undibacterium sp. Jales W-56]MCU6435083.1 GAF domain-containing sensor histidine kinase [Undibacterium sp. Jales W-56]
MTTETMGEAQLAEDLRHGQNKLLEMIARGAPLQETLARLMQLIEAQSHGVLCSVLLLDQDGIHIRKGAGPSLPESYMNALDGFSIGPTAGSCGTAMYLKKMVIVKDITTDPLWAPYKALVEPFGFRACWSTPIYLNSDKILGTFAMYYREIREPGKEDLKLIEVATHLAGIAIERTRREEELDLHRTHLTELVAERTAELSMAKERAEISNMALSKANQELANALNNLSITQEELVRRDKLAALAALVAGVAHELNTPIGNGLMVASTLSELTQEFAHSYQSGIKRSSLAHYVAEAMQASDILQRNLQRAADLVNSFKQVSIDEANYKRSTFVLGNFVAETVASLNGALEKNAVQLMQNLPSGLTINSYQGPLAQVLINLINNCLIHAFEQTDHRVIEIAASIHPKWIKLSVRDNGKGIPENDLKHIYDPFFTTKLGAGSSGLGLHITHNIVTSLLDGKIDVQSSLNSGTCFTISLPI